MKSILFIGLCLLGACKPSVKSFIEGTYINQTDGQLSKAVNTLVIKPYDQNNGSYTVQYTSRYQRKKNGALQPVQSMNKTMTFLYNSSTGRLEEPTSGKVILFSPDSGTLLYGASEYQKVK